MQDTDTDERPSPSFVQAFDYTGPTEVERAVFRRQFAIESALKFTGGSNGYDPSELIGIARRIDAFVTGETSTQA